MKCSFCGKELPQGAEFCPECGMILSLGGAVEEKEAPAEAEIEIPDVPNVFQPMEFEEEVSEPAMELEAADEEEAAPVVEVIPEYVAEEAVEEEAEEAIEEAVPEMTEQEIFAVPEYDPTREVSAEFIEELEKEKAAMPQIEVEDVPDEQATIKFTPPVVAEPPVIIRAEKPEPEFAPPEYDDTPVYQQEAEESEAEQEAYVEEPAYEEEPAYVEEPAVQYEVAEADEDDYNYAEDEGEIYPVYSDEQSDAVPEANPLEDNSLIEALFDGMTEDADEEEVIEDITHTYNEKPKKKKSSKGSGFGVLAALVVVLVGIIFASGYVVDNIFPEVKEKLGFETTFPTSQTTTDADESTTETTTAASSQSTTESTTGKGTTSATTTTKEPETDIFGDEVTTEKSTTEKATTEKVTTTKAPETTKKPATTAPATTQQSSYVEEPSSYNMYETAYFPYDDVKLKTSPSSSAGNVITHPYGYPLYAYAYENGYYYVHSPYHDVMGWVATSSVYEYEPTTQSSAGSSSSSSSSGSGYVDYSYSYTAMVMSTSGLNFRTGPGTDYGVSAVVPGGYYVRVYGYSETRPGWVYVTVEDSRYPYASPSGWVSESYLG